MDATRLLAPGVPIEVAGRDHTLRFSLLALKRLEDSFGSINEAETRIVTVCKAATAADFPEPVVSDLGLALAAGTGLQPLQVLEGYEGRLQTAADDLWDAWTQAWPDFTTPDAEGKAQADGTGDPSTTPPPSDGDAPTPSSGE